MSMISWIDVLLLSLKTENVKSIYKYPRAVDRIELTRNLSSIKLIYKSNKKKNKRKINDLFIFNLKSSLRCKRSMNGMKSISGKASGSLKYSIVITDDNGENTKNPQAMRIRFVFSKVKLIFPMVALSIPITF